MVGQCCSCWEMGRESWWKIGWPGSWKQAGEKWVDDCAGRKRAQTTPPRAVVEGGDTHKQAAGTSCN
jgi:hypothetical protein